MGKRPLAALAALFVLAPSAGVGAAEGDAAHRQATTLGETGKAAYRDGRYDDAIIAFKAAFKTEALPKFLYNLGLAYRKKGADQAAIAAFERYLHGTPEAEDADNVQAAMSFLRTRLEETRVELRVLTKPSGAALELSGADDDVRGTTPYVGWHEPGSYELHLQAQDHEPFDKALVLALGSPTELELELSLTPRPEVAQAPPAPSLGRSSGSPPSGHAVPEAAPRSPPASAKSPPKASVWPTVAWTTAGIALLSAGLFALIAQGKADQLEVYAGERRSPGRTREGAQQLDDSVAMFGAAATGSLALAGAALATGVVLTW